MTVTHNDTLLDELLHILDESVEQATPESNGTPPLGEPAKKYAFRRGDRVTGEHQIPTAVEVLSPTPPAAAPKEEERTDDSDFSTLMGKKIVQPQGWSWESLSTKERQLYTAGGFALAFFLFIAAIFMVQSVGKPQVVVVRPTTIPAPVIVAQPTLVQAPVAQAAPGCDGYQYYHSPDESDVGPCVPKDAKVVPTGTYGDDGIWLFMILPSGELKWAKAADYGYTSAQVLSMQLRDFKPKPPQPTQQPQEGAVGGAEPWEPGDGPPPAQATVEPTIAPTAAPSPIPSPTPEGRRPGKPNAPGSEKPAPTQATRPEWAPKIPKNQTVP